MAKGKTRADKNDIPREGGDGSETGRSLSRRQMLVNTSAALSAGAVALQASRAAAADVPGAQRSRARSAAATGRPYAEQKALPPGLPGRDYAPVVVPNGMKAPWKIVNGVKVFHMVAEEIEHEFAPGLRATCWGYNGAVHGPMLEWVEGERVRIYDEWRLDVGTSRPNPNEMKDFNLLTINANAFPGTEPLVVQTGQRVRIRIGNLSPMDHHPIHLHGYQFRITETDGGEIADNAQWPETTVLVPVGSTRTIEFVADEPGDWALHCHMTHHVMNQMGHDIPNMIGMRPGAIDQQVRQLLPGYMTMGQHGMGDMGEMGMAVPRNSLPMVGAQGKHDYITMGGMFTVLKVRNQLASYRDPGWYENPPGTLAELARAADLGRDAIDVSSPPKAERGGDA